MGITLYGNSCSPCTMNLMVLLTEKEVEYEMVTVDYLSNEHKKPPYSDMNPFGQIPIFQDGDLVLFESRAIAAYIAEKYRDKGTPLLGNTVEEAAMVRVWVDVGANHFEPAANPIILEQTSNWDYGTELNQAVVDENVKKLEKVYDAYEIQLSKTKYLAGDFFSLADLLHINPIDKLTYTSAGSLLDDRPHLKAWWDDICSRPSY
ncbi:glutathione S-transferase F13-like [Cornus florida]|uniref:glutathione S-transferase F13-like n=1 Tax=Cornus florida TaxID=4283 RepID=UPI00289ED528|nr:glutathione S-transferase F13-like [Cornus florida]